MFRFSPIVLAAALVACGSGNGIEPDRQTDGIGASTDTGAGSPSINGGAGTSSINGGAGDPSINGGAGSSAIGGAGSGSGAASGISCVTFDNAGAPECVCLPSASVPSGSTALAACPANDCCVRLSTPNSDGVTCVCSAFAALDAQWGAGTTCSQAASLSGGSVVSSCP